MKLLLKKNQVIIKLLFAISLFSFYTSNAQSITEKDKNILSLSIKCPNNPQCIYSGKNFSSNLIITNNTNQNLEISLIAIDAISMSSYFKDIKTNEGISGSYSLAGLMNPYLLKKLTLLPAHGTQTIKREFSKTVMKEIFKKSSSKQVIFHVALSTPIHLQGSQEPIGSYKNGKFEPKSFILKAKKVITKK